jgi:hypothetical protein
MVSSLDLVVPGTRGVAARSVVPAFHKRVTIRRAMAGIKKAIPEEIAFGITAMLVASRSAQYDLP